MKINQSTEKNKKLNGVSIYTPEPVKTIRTRKNPYTTYDVEGVFPPGDLVSVLKCSRGVGGVVGGEGMQLVRVGRWMVCLRQRNISII